MSKNKLPPKHLGTYRRAMLLLEHNEAALKLTRGQRRSALMPDPKSVKETVNTNKS